MNETPGSSGPSWMRWTSSGDRKTAGTPWIPGQTSRAPAAKKSSARTAQALRVARMSPSVSVSFTRAPPPQAGRTVPSASARICAAQTAT